MALSNSQYDQLMRDYEQLQLDNEHELRLRFDEVYAKIPKLRTIDDTISSLSVEKAKRLLEGDEDALSSFHEKLLTLTGEKQKLLTSHGFPSDYLEKHYHCPDCQDTGYIGTRKCHCMKKAIIELLYNDSNLKGILEQENFHTFSLDYYSKSHIDPLTGRSARDAIETALRVCHHFIDTFSSEFHNILLYGDTGVGKTFLTHCIAKELMDHSYSVIYFSAAGLFDFLAKNTFGKRDEIDEDALSHICSCDLLIIDDLGTELANSFTVSQLFVILNERILRKEATIISTNLSLEDIKAIYSERIFSRISSSYSMLRLTGDDIRIQKKLLNLRRYKRCYAVTNVILTTSLQEHLESSQLMAARRWERKSIISSLHGAMKMDTNSWMM